MPGNCRWRGEIKPRHLLTSSSAKLTATLVVATGRISYAQMLPETFRTAGLCLDAHELSGERDAPMTRFRRLRQARGKAKEPLAKQLGASIYIDSQQQDPAAELSKLGGVKVILATLTDAPAVAAVLGGLAIDGKLVVLGAPREPIPMPPALLISGRRSVAGWPSGTSIESQDTVAFSVLAGVRPLTETFPLERAAKAYERMMKGKARFRVVLAT